MTDAADRLAEEPATGRVGSTDVAGSADVPVIDSVGSTDVVPKPLPSESGGATDRPEPATAPESDPAAVAEAPPGAGAAPASMPGPGPAHAPPRRTRRAGRAPDTHLAAPPDSSRLPPGRPAPLRVARLHLRMGQLQLARAELEALAGRAALDEPALLDLAEARWRTGDLAGAGEAATAVLARGRDDALALLILAESVAAEGRPGEARRLAARALALVEGPLDPVFAGMPRSLIWPEDAPAPPDPSAAPGAAMATGQVDHGPGRRARHAAAGDLETPASTAAAEAYAGGRAALAGGDVGEAALRLGVALRLDPGFAEGVLEAVGAWERDPALALVAGDALRLLGREVEALAAFDMARGRG